MFQVQFAQAIERSVKDLLDKHCAWLPLHPDQMTHALLVVVLCATVSVAENVVRANLVPSRQMTLYIFFCLFFLLPSGGVRIQKFTRQAGTQVNSF